MTKKIRNLVVIGLLILSALTLGEKVKITNGEWAPWLSENYKHYGVASHIVTEAFAKEGIEVEYGFFPWARSYDLVKRGRWDGSILWSETEERKKDVYYSDPVMYSDTVFFYKKGTDFDWETIDDLKGLTIGTTIGYAYQGLDEYVEEKNLDIEQAPNDETNLKKLLAGRIDIFPLDKDIGYEMIRNEFDSEDFGKLTHHSKPITQKSYKLILTRKDPENKELMKKFNKGLNKLKESGEYDEFIQNSLEGNYAK
ncbi:MAG: substrate-binding periplasmic protein [Fusobacteriota bacterium]